MTSFRLAWGFLTAFPAPRQGMAEPTDFARSRIWYPLVGLALGLVWWGTASGAAHLHAPTAVGAFAILAAMLLSTGFLHLDGLLDSGDALLCPKSPEDRLRIMKDVHLGAFAFGVGALWILGMAATLSNLREPLVLLVLPILSRGILLLPMRIFPYARAHGGYGMSTHLPRALWIFPIICTLAAAAFFPAAAITILVTQFAFAWWASRRLGGGITGDIYGASLCISELAALLVHSCGA